jgi:hypothetical protein
MVDSFHDDRPISRGQHAQEPIVHDPQLVLVRTDEPLEEPLRTFARTFQFRDRSTGDRRIETGEIADGRLRPLE